MDQYLTPEANEIFDRMASLRKRRRVFSRMLAFVENKIDSYIDSVPKKYIIKRDKCLYGIQNNTFEYNKASYFKDKLIRDGNFFK